ncbi:MAG: metal-dependent hydrolase [Planctomycetota bacterium]|nr:MAG: metal-dependent hydrolase [Planctomycetota bacterium]
MSVELTFLGHAGFVLRSGDSSVAIDPFLTGNPVAKHKPGDVRCSHIVLTHGHADHVGDAVAIAKANDSTCYGAFELCNYLSQQGVKKCEPGNPGGRIQTDFGWVAFTQAFHSSSYEGHYMGMPCGAVVNLGGVTFYHCGDTALFGDMKLLGEIYQPQVAMIPVGDRFTMGPELGGKAAELIRPRIAIPIHYGTWPLLTSDISAFRPEGVEVRALQPGETMTVEA